MADQSLTVRFWGTRGSVPAPGPAARQFGADTACVEVTNGSNALIFDAGSGLRRLGLTFADRKIETADIFFSHCHYDHIIGLPFFTPLFDPSVPVTLWSGHLYGCMTTRQMVEEFMRAPFFPVRPEVFSPATRYVDFAPGDTLHPPGAAVIHTGPLNHTDGAIGYRLESGGKAIAYITDHEHGNPAADATVDRLIAGADMLIIDATYTDAEYPTHRGWGHSTWQHAALLCRRQQVKRLVLFHHRPRRADSDLASIERDARQVFPATVVASDDLEITV
jgi:phosphoribosyl 1,2-cyclic phosphodiesterase